MHTFNDRATCLSHGGVLQNCSVLSGTKAAVPGHRTGKSTSTRAQWHGVNLDKLQPDGGRTWREKKGFIYNNNNKKSAEKRAITQIEGLTIKSRQRLDGFGRNKGNTNNERDREKERNRGQQLTKQKDKVRKESCYLSIPGWTTQTR